MTMAATFGMAFSIFVGSFAVAFFSVDNSFVVAFEFFQLLHVAGSFAAAIFVAGFQGGLLGMGTPRGPTDDGCAEWGRLRCAFLVVVSFSRAFVAVVFLATAFAMGDALLKVAVGWLQVTLQ